jgi:hypothetical protein
MKYHGFSMNVTTQFTPHKGDIHIYCHHDHKFNWSISQKKKYPTLLKEYHDVVKTLYTGNIIVLRNNGEKTTKLPRENKVTHNVHGLNTAEMQATCNTSCESALIPHPAQYSFITQTWLAAYTSKKDSEHLKRCIKQMYMAHLFYQVIMRGILRTRTYNNERVNIFVLDQMTATCLSEYFEFTDSHEMDFTKNVMPPKKIPLTSTQRSQKARALKKNP